MKQSILYFILAGLALIATACEKDSLLEGYEGSVSLSVEMPSITTRADESDSGITPDAVKVRIYREDGVTLIRRYTSLNEIPNPLYLVAGKYVVKAEGGDFNNTAFVKPTADTDAEALALLRKKLCYQGQKKIEIIAKGDINETIACKTINSQINVNFDARDEAMDNTGRVRYENRMLRNVKVMVAALDWAKIEDSNEDSKISVEEFKAAVTKQKAPKLEFKFTGEEYEAKAYNGIGYYIVPENAANTFVWAFEATHVGDEANSSPADGNVAQVGKMTNIKAGFGYTVDFCYSRTPDGFAGVNILVDDYVEEIEETIYFKPQPTISGEGIGDGPNIYKFGGNGISLKCESINPLTSIKIGDVEFFGNGNSEVIDNAIPGVVATKKSPTLVEFTIGDAYFKDLSGASQTLEFNMTDAGGADVYTQNILIKKRGLMFDEIKPDLWANTAEFKAFVPEDNAGEVKIQFRKKGSSEWVTLEATDGDNDKVYAKTSSPVWIAYNAQEKPVSDGEQTFAYRPNTNKSIFANSEYECQLLVSGNVVDTGILTTSTQQYIPGGDFNDNYSCFKDGNIASMWGSGNNGYTPDLCSRSQEYVTGENNYCAYLDANYADYFVVQAMAAGNLFVGSFSMSGSTGKVSFGNKYIWDARPSTLNLEYLAKIGAVNYTKYSHTNEIAQGVQDEASIYVAIVDWGKQHAVTSGMDKPTGVWSPEDGPTPLDSDGYRVGGDDGKIIGYGVFNPKEMMTGGLVDKEIPIYYYNPEDAKPDGKNRFTLVIAAATSRYGDYMNGCTDNKMWIDNFHWGYNNLTNEVH